MVMTVLKQLKYSFTLIFHPFDGFWDLKHEKRGSAKAALVILALLCVQQIFKTISNYRISVIFYTISSKYYNFFAHNRIIPYTINI